MGGESSRGCHYVDRCILTVRPLLHTVAETRYVNNLEEDEYKKKEVQNTLKMLRTNVRPISHSALAPPLTQVQLKLAIDSSLLPNANSHLLSSYLQVLIMSEGDAWVLKSVHDLGLLMRDEHSKPAAEAEAMVRKFSTKELRGVAGGVGDVEEYIANAALDLVIMSAWSVAAAQIDTDMLPVSLSWRVRVLTGRHIHSRAICERSCSYRMSSSCTEISCNV